MSFGIEESNNEVMSEINMTPLVDVMLVLLIIFIITVPVITHTVTIDLPHVNNIPNNATPETVMLSIGSDTQIHWNDEIILKEELLQRLATAAAQEPQPEIQLRGARDIAYEYVINIMAAVQQAGITTLGFVTDPS